MIIERLLLLEDHHQNAERLKKILGSAFAIGVIDHSTCLSHARALLKLAHTYTIAVLDIGLPDGNGIDLITEIKHSSPLCKIVMSTIFDDDQSLFKALHSGANGYLLKEQSDADIENKLIRLLRHGEPPLSPGIARRILDQFKKPEDNSDVSLSPRESETLTLLAKGYSVKELAKLLDISHNTAAGYVKIIYQKLQINNRAEAVNEARRMGLVFS